jgi:hypothetical protein
MCILCTWNILVHMNIVMYVHTVHMEHCGAPADTSLAAGVSPTETLNSENEEIFCGCTYYCSCKRHSD